MVILLFACADPAEESTTLAPVDVLIRASLDLRGVRPSTEEFEALEDDPKSLDDTVAGFADDARLGSRVADLWSELYLTRTDAYTLAGSQFGIDDEQAFVSSIGDEPLQLLGYVADHDLPWTEIVTADWTMANETLGAVFPVDYPAGSEGWIKTTYTDDRPAAGVLAQNALWWRYTSTESNANRKRANVISRLFLCNDYLTRPLTFDRTVSLLDESAVQDALTQDARCINCHSSLDPIAGFLFGFWYLDYYDTYEMTGYHPEREREWQDTTEVPPGYFGRSGSSLAELGAWIAEDPRFATCAVQQAWELVLRRPATLDDTDALVRHREAFIAGGGTMRALLASIVTDPAYRAGDDTAGGVSAKLITPLQLASEIEDLTGFRWTTAGGYDVFRIDASGLEDKDGLLAAEATGYRTLSGGADGYNVTTTATTPNTTFVLVHERLAEAAADHVVQQEPERLLSGVTFEERPDTDRAAMAATIQALHLRLYGARVEADGEEVDAALELWDALYALDQDPREAWTGVLAVLLRDPRLVVY